MYIIIANKDSYYHERFWAGEKFTKNRSKAKIFSSFKDVKQSKKYIELPNQQFQLI